MRARATAAVVALALGAAACAGGDEGSPAGGPTTEAPASSTTRATPSTPRPRVTTTASTPPATAPERHPDCPLPRRAAPDPHRPVYVLDLDVRPSEGDHGAVHGAVSVRFTPDRPVKRLVFRLWANGPRPAAAGARLTTGAVTVDGADAPARRPDATTLVVPIPGGGGVAPGDTVAARMAFTLRLPGPVNDRLATDRGAIRLGSFYPVLEWEPGVGWNTRPPTSGFAEASVAPVADYTVRIDKPAGLDVMMTGDFVRPGEWRATAVRDVAISMGRFRRVITTARAPQPVEVAVAVHAGVAAAPQDYAAKAARMLERLSRELGPYPWPRYALAVTPGLSGGIEYPMHVMQGPLTLGRTTTHEIAHMWFYGLVGNHQGRDPWLDEGLASYAEGIAEGTLADFEAKAIPAGAAGHLGEPMTYWESRQGVYYRGVYVQGAQALADLGPRARVTCALRRYVAREAHAIATPDDLLDALATELPGARAVLDGYGARFAMH